ncbi:hypothetical protein [Brevibacterium paucivorans]|uniref:hypothetical protein n=1 Tax=Brevibacterium paucivorans TaxID=170994 RepID=UPI003219A97D
MYALDLIDGLPSASRFRQALLNDEQVAEQIIRAQDEAETNGSPQESWRLQVSENTPEVILLTHVLQALDDISGLVLAQASQGKKKHKPRPLPVPRTAVDTVRERKTKEKAQEIASIFLPHETQ